ncbi:hypothetical protein LTS10_010304 [Elasticomyces elasticus]|nr:hypothetical protein LTS10_010304 [Elasticomyces elasticus]
MITVGTWLAVFLALFALLGVVGPLLVWRASKSARNKALVALDAGKRENGGFLTRGVHIGFKVKLFRRVRAPDLTADPLVSKQIIQWDCSKPVPHPLSASWVGIGTTLNGYGIAYDRKDTLLIEDERTVLPIGRTWLILLGLVGRFGRRPDDGKYPVPLTAAVRSSQARTGHGILEDISRTTHGRKEPDIRQMTRDFDNPRTWNREAPMTPDTRSDCQRAVLSGVVGILDVDSTLRPQVIYHHHDAVAIGDMVDESLSIDKLFWLSVGCIPACDGKVFSLEDVVQVQMSLPHNPELPGQMPTTYGFDVVGFRNERHPIYVPQALPLRQHMFYDGDIVPRLFRFATLSDRDQSLLGVAAIFGAEDNDTEALSFQEVEIVPEDLEKMKADAGRSYVRSERPWIMLRHDVESAPFECWFLNKESGKQLAHALVDLPLSRLGYIIHRPRHSACRQLLVAATLYMPLLLVRISREVEALDLVDDRKKMLADLMLAMWRHTRDFEYTRTFSIVICLLDQILELCTTASKQAQRAIQILAIINPEFRDIISSSAQRIAECIGSNTLIDYDAGTVNVPTFMGVLLKFPMHLDQPKQCPLR